LGIEEPSVPILKIARHLGAKVRYERTDRDISGFIFRHGDGFVVIGIDHFFRTNRSGIS
jgi:hypothetical protein